jgi:hypothetical protein
MRGWLGAFAVCTRKLLNFTLCAAIIGALLVVSWSASEGTLDSPGEKSAGLTIVYKNQSYPGIRQLYERKVASDRALTGEPFQFSSQGQWI